MKTKRCYKQGVIQTDAHTYLKKGCIVDIISETKDCYLVQSFVTGIPEFIKKEHLKINE